MMDFWRKISYMDYMNRRYNKQADPGYNAMISYVAGNLD